MKMLKSVGAFITRAVFLKDGCSRLEFFVTFCTFSLLFVTAWVFIDFFPYKYDNMYTYAALLGTAFTGLSLASATFFRGSQVGLKWAGGILASLFAVINSAGSLVTALALYGRTDMYGFVMLLGFVWFLPIMTLATFILPFGLLPPKQELPQQQLNSTKQLKTEVQP